MMSEDLQLLKDEITSILHDILADSNSSESLRKDFTLEKADIEVEIKVSQDGNLLQRCRKKYARCPAVPIQHPAGGCIHNC